MFNYKNRFILPWNFFLGLYPKKSNAQVGKSENEQFGVTLEPMTTVVDEEFDFLCDKF